MRLAQLASSGQAELLLSPSSVCLDGIPMVATGSGLYFEHVYRMGSVLTAMQTRRQCSKNFPENIYISLRSHPQDTPTNRWVHSRSPTTWDWTGVGGRASRAFVGVSVAGKGLSLPTPQ